MLHFHVNITIFLRSTLERLTSLTVLEIWLFKVCYDGTRTKQKSTHNTLQNLIWSLKWQPKTLCRPIRTKRHRESYATLSSALRFETFSERRWRLNCLRCDTKLPYKKAGREYCRIILHQHGSQKTAWFFWFDVNLNKFCKRPIAFKSKLSVQPRRSEVLPLSTRLTKRRKNALPFHKTDSST